MTWMPAEVDADDTGISAKKQETELQQVFADFPALFQTPGWTELLGKKIHIKDLYSISYTRFQSSWCKG